MVNLGVPTWLTLQRLSQFRVQDSDSESSVINPDRNFGHFDWGNHPSREKKGVAAPLKLRALSSQERVAGQTRVEWLIQFFSLHLRFCKER